MILLPPLIQGSKKQRIRTGFPFSGSDINFFHSGTGMIRCRTVRRSGLKKLQEGGKRNTLHVYTVGGVQAYTPQVHTAGIYRNVGPLLLNMLYDTDKSLVTDGMPEKVRHRHFSRQSTLLVRHRYAASGSVRYRWSRISPANKHKSTGSEFSSHRCTWHGSPSQLLYGICIKGTVQRDGSGRNQAHSIGLF